MLENVLDTMKSCLEAHMTEELGKQDGHAANGITCLPIASYIIGDETPPNTGLPAIILRGDSTAEITQFVQGKKDVSYNIAIGVAVTSTDEDTSQRMLWRTMRAIENVLENYLPGVGQIIEYKTTDLNFHASIFTIEDGRSTEKGGFVTAQVKERMDAYTPGQI
jgi:hypothetical protein